MVEVVSLRAQQGNKDIACDARGSAMARAQPGLVAALVTAIERHQISTMRDIRRVGCYCLKRTPKSL